jgi:TRAP-type mannitol/chloroaromatic compound transport system permease small subunit
VDILTSVFFFLFCGALLWTGWVFTMDSIEVWEVSFTEWAIQYWPVKSTMAIGALLILLQGLSKLAKDIRILAGKEA